MAMNISRPEEDEFVKALADRLGIPHENALRDVHAEFAGNNVWVTVTVCKMLPVEDYNELVVVAALRAQEKTGD